MKKGGIIRVNLGRNQYEITMKEYLKKSIGTVLERDLTEIDEDESLLDAGLDSLLIFDLMDQMKDDFKNLKSRLFFEYNTIDKLSNYFIDKFHDEVSVLVQKRGNRYNQKEDVENVKVINKEPLHPKGSKVKAPDIAIIGVAGKYPQAEDLTSFWDNISKGMDCITKFPSNRWEQARANWKGNQWGGFIKDIDKFDYQFFNMTKSQAEMSDPQLRVMMEVVWSALEDAGYPYQSFSDRKEKVGTFIGNMYGGFGQVAYERWLDGGSSLPQSSYWMIPNRVSYYYDFKGPSIAVDTACSSSLTALTLACQSIHNKECTAAVVGGVNIIANPMQNTRLDKLGQLSQKGTVNSFSEEADGYVEGEGAGAIIIKPLEAAIEDGDYIYGVIKGAVCNHNGETADFMVPNIEGEVDVLKKAIKDSGIKAESLSYIEAHAAGTKIGDAIEVDALTRAFENITKDKEFCAIGTVKANVGHLEGAAGICAITKVLLQMKYETLVPTIHCEMLNKEINLPNTPFYINREKKDWMPALKLEDHKIVKQPLCAAVCSFGAGGANSVVILESYENKLGSTEQLEDFEFIYSARTEESLLNYLASFKRFLIENKQEISHKMLLSNIASTLRDRRVRMERTIIINAKTVEELIEKLDAVLLERHLENSKVPDPTIEKFKKFPHIPLPTYCFEKYEVGMFPQTQEQEIVSKRTIAVKDNEVAGHVSFGKETLLGMALCSEALSICNEYACKMNAICLEDVTFHESLIMANRSNTTIETKLTREFLKNRIVITDTANDLGNSILLSAKAEFLSSNTITDKKVNMPRWEREISINGGEIYNRKNDVYGEKFHFIEEYIKSNDTVWLRVKVPKEYIENQSYFINPYVLDAALLGRVAFAKDAQDKTIPLNIKNIYLFRLINETEYHCKVDIVNQSENMWEGNIEIYDIAGQLCVLMDGVLCVAQDKTSQYVNTDKSIIPKNIHNLTKENIHNSIRQIIYTLTSIDMNEVAEQTSFIRMGMKSVQIVQFAEQLSHKLCVDIHPSLLFEYSSVSSLTDYLLREHSISSKDTIPVSKITTKQSYKTEYGNDIAIIGLSAMMPGSDDLNEFWKHLESGDYLVGSAPDARFHDAMYSDKERLGAFVKNMDQFDASFFDISPREAELMDPQQRVCLQLAWKAVEDAGYNARDLMGSDTAVMIGVAGHDYNNIVNQGEVPSYGQSLLGNSHNILTGRISYFMDWHGPSEPINCACASALVAINRGIECIRNGTSQMALTGGVNLLADEYLYDAFSNLGILSKSGICNPFDKNADGTVRGEGAGMILIKSLEQAKQDGDHIYGVIKGSSVNHDGKSSSLTAPNGNQQKEVIIKALTQANISPDSISYIEAHGTGTHIGDSIEVEAIKNAYKEMFDRWNLDYGRELNCGIGTVKSNIGHLESAAGIAGVIKVILCMKFHKLTGLVNLVDINPLIKLEDTPFYLVNRTKEWEKKLDLEGKEIPYRAEIHSFGLSGVNSSLIIEDYIEDKKEEHTQKESIICLSAKSEHALQRMAQSLLYFVKNCSEHDQIGLEKLSYTLLNGRTAWDYRIAFIVSTFEELTSKLEDYLTGKVNMEGSYKAKKDKENAKSLSLFDEEMTQVLVTQLAKARNLDKLGRLWVLGLDIKSWGILFSNHPTKVSIPTYPFEETTYWFAKNSRVPVERTPISKPVKPELVEQEPLEQEAEIMQKVKKMIAEISGFTLDELEENEDLREYGFNSINYIELSNSINELFHTNMTPADFYELSELTINSLFNILS